MDELFNSCPRMDIPALGQEILSGPLVNDNYLFYRTGTPEAQWMMEDEPECWEMHCTSCGMTFFRQKKRGASPKKDIGTCPECGALVCVKTWSEKRVKLRTRILYYKFQRGEGRRIWLRAYQAEHNFCPAPGDERLELTEVSRYLFDDSCSVKWSRSMAYFGRPLITADWARRKRVTKTTWQRNAMQMMEPYATHIGDAGPETLGGSCLEYSQIQQAINAGIDPAEYAAYYLRYPMIEYLWRFGLGHFVREALVDGAKNELRMTANLKAKRPRDLFPELTVSEVRRIAEAQTSMHALRVYRDLKLAGVVEDSDAGLAWAEAIASAGSIPDRAAEHGVDGRALRRFVEHQAQRSEVSIGLVLHDYGDYLRQLDQIGGGDATPSNLLMAHERLSARLRTVTDLELNTRFRVRRHLYRWLCWRYNGMLIRPVDSANEINFEGECQRNCVAGYARRHADGNTIICVLRRTDAPRDSWHTVELNPKTLDVVQCRGFRNSAAEPEAQEFIELWSNRLKSIQSGRRTE